jgi:hypothetical protein
MSCCGRAVMLLAAFLRHTSAHMTSLLLHCSALCRLSHELWSYQPPKRCPSSGNSNSRSSCVTRARRCCPRWRASILTTTQISPQLKTVQWNLDSSVSSRCGGSQQTNDGKGKAMDAGTLSNTIWSGITEIEQ